VIAATTATLCGIGYQRKYSVKQVNDLINLCLCSYAGAICDGAKISCAWKIEAALISGFAAMEIVEHNASIPNGGMINKDAFETIRDLGKLSHKIMDETNSAVIDIVNKNDNK
jgi:L-cysteine desulfidase